ncbi:MAG: DUF1801 domain-containing protein [Arcicella sp.]|jgi:hypothetical protein|nr:DUF1801 domain-containing protein [Arcicella sp.]
MPKYYDIDDFIASKDITLRPLLHHIRKIIMLAHPNIREQISWNTPFFYCLDHLCYFGVIKKTKGVEVCFVKGFHLSNDSGLLDAKDRKLTKGITFSSLEDFQEKEEIFLEILQEAILFNEMNPDLKFYNMVVKGKNGEG